MIHEAGSVQATKTNNHMAVRIATLTQAVEPEDPGQGTSHLHKHKLMASGIVKSRRETTSDDL